MSLLVLLLLLNVSVYDSPDCSCVAEEKDPVSPLLWRTIQIANSGRETAGLSLYTSIYAAEKSTFLEKCSELPQGRLRRKDEDVWAAKFAEHTTCLRL